MRKIAELQTTAGFLIHIRFDNGTEKVFDLKPYLNLPVFKPLQMEKLFQRVVNRGYFIEWTNLEIDLSADTLWHEGKTKTIES
ncbi:MAG: DUF2442 domain-containing protein [Bacteroidia bacterium]